MTENNQSEAAKKEESWQGEMKQRLENKQNKASFGKRKANADPLNKKNCQLNPMFWAWLAV
jgi:hypothetical protein